MPDLEDLYREIILDHYRSPRNRGELRVAAGPPGRGFQPAVRRRDRGLRSTSTDGAVTDIKIAGTGCSISQSSASLMSAAVKGKPVDEVRDLIAHLQGDDVHPRGHPAVDGADGTTARREGRARGHRPRRRSASWPPSREWSSSRSASSAPPSAGTPWPRVSTRRAPPAEPALSRPGRPAGAGRAGPPALSRGSGSKFGLDRGRGRRRAPLVAGVDPRRSVRWSTASWWWSRGRRLAVGVGRRGRQPGQAGHRGTG